MIEIVPWDDRLALQVMQDLDVNDQIEAVLHVGIAAPLALFADWRQSVGGGTVIALERWRPDTPAVPFAMVAVVPSAARGVAGAAMVARHHRRWRAALGRLAVLIRRQVAAEAADRGYTRIECRSWSEHPTAGRLLAGIGFRREAELAGFSGGKATFHQWAWTPEEEI